MKLAVGCDHRGFHAKLQILNLLTRLGHTCQDFGCHGSSPVDYPPFAASTAKAIALHQCDLGILVGGNGIGLCIAANKIHGIRAAVAHDEFVARATREQEHCNLICLAADLNSGRHLGSIVESFLSATPADGRYARRVEQLMQLENPAPQSLPVFDVVTEDQEYRDPPALSLAELAMLTKGDRHEYLEKLA